MHSFVLFSPVGMTDPISYNRDGALLHICRKYRPIKIYLYFSKEMLELHQKDNRFIDSINRLMESTGFSIDIEIIERGELTEVHRFDDFYWEFEQLLTKISKESPDCSVLLNLSSGSPAMKSALQTISALSDSRYKAIQVSTPLKRSNTDRNYDKASEWASNIDNCEYIDRTEESHSINLLARIKKEMILKHVDVYDYHAAFSIAESIREHISNDSLSILKSACCRVQLDLASIRADEVMNAVISTLLPHFEDDSKRMFFEYFLWLRIKQERADLADFIRGITPVIVDLFEMILARECGIEIKKHCKIESRKESRKKEKRKIIILAREKLVETDEGKHILETLDEKFKKAGVGEFKDSPLYSSNLFPIIEKFHMNEEAKKEAEQIRKIEDNIRNLAAHEICSVTEEWINDRCGMSSKDIIELLRKTVIRVYPDWEEYWDSYNKMNMVIYQQFQESSGYNA